MNMRWLALLVSLCGATAVAAPASLVEGLEGRLTAIPQDNLRVFESLEVRKNRASMPVFAVRELDREGSMAWLGYCMATESRDEVRQACTDGWIRGLRRGEAETIDESLWLWGLSSGDAGLEERLTSALRFAEPAFLTKAGPLAVSHPDAEIRRLVSHAASMNPSGELMEKELQTLTQDKAPAVRAESIRALGIVGTSSSVPLVIAALEDTGEKVAYEALRALKRLDLGKAKEIAKTLVEHGDTRVERLAKELSREE